MTRRPKAATLAMIVILLLGASACGQMGPLSLPDDTADDDTDEDSNDADER